jgi:histidyl-tRNA synthetase
VIQVPRGTFDVLGEDAARRELFERRAKAILEAAGYRRIETPTFEATELFARGVGEATDIVRHEMYSFDDGAGRSLTLRPEGTAPVCRAYIEHGMHKLPQPVKLFYLETFFRAETPQKGRYRQFWQVGAEAIGSAAPETDAELIVLLADLLEAAGAGEVTLKLSSLGTPETRVEYREELKRYLRAHERQLAPEVRERIDANPLRAFDAKDPGTQEVMRSAPTLLERIEGDDAEHFAQVRALLDGAGLTYELEPTLVRGLDYYTRTVYEFESPLLGAQSVLGGGGRYDRLIEQLDGPSTPASGWAAGVDRILLAAEEAGAPPAEPEAVDLFVALADQAAAERAFALAREARRAGLKAQQELAGRSLKGQLRHADRIGARYVAIMGEDGHTSLREMASGEQQDVAPESVIATVAKR